MSNPQIEGAVDEARAFVKLLLEAARQREYPIYIALTLRSELLGGTVALHGLPEAINQGLHLLPQMSREQLRDVIKCPVELDGVRIDERLVDRMLNDLGDRHDHLPVLQHALMRMWSEWAHSDDESIGLAHYKKIGTLETSLSRHAENVFLEHLNIEQRKVVEAVFRSITDTVGGQIVRSPLKFQKILEFTKETDADKVRRVIDEFRQDGRSFLLPRISQPLTAETVVDISHESLFRQWTRLRRWAEDEALKKELHRQISESALLWQKKDFNDDFLFRGARLIEADGWAKDNGDKLTELETRFLEASRNLYRTELLRRPEQELSEKVVEEGMRHGRAVEKGTARVYIDYSRKDKAFAVHLYDALNAIGVDVVMDLDILPGTSWSEQLKDWVEETDAFIFVISPDSVRSAPARKELEYALNLNKRVIPVVCRPVEVESVPEILRQLQWIFLTDEKEFDRGTETLGKVINTDLYWSRTHARLSVRAAEWDRAKRDKGMLLRGTELREAEGWLAQATANKEPNPTVLQVQYITASRKAQYKRQRLMLTSLIAVLLVTIMLSVVAFVQARRAMALKALAEAQAERAKASEQQARLALREALLANQASGTAISPDGKWLFTVSNGQGRLIDIDTGKSLLVAEGSIRSTSFSPDGRFIAFGYSDGRVVSMELSTQTVYLLSKEGGGVRKVAFSPDSRLLAAAGDDGLAPVWDVESRQLIIRVRNPENDPFVDVGFSPDGKRLIVTSSDGVPTIWDVVTR